MPSKSTNRLNLGIIGCGAVTESRYLRSVNLLSDLVVTHVADLNFARAKYVADRFKIPNFTKNYQDLFGRVDAVVVATPPSSHARISIDCMRQGIHVLCEKPLATSIQQATEMVEVGRQNNTHLAVGMVRRLSWASQLLKRLIESNFLGNITRVDIEEGFEFNWPLQTDHLFQKKEFGGVLADTGFHMFDLVFWLFESDQVTLLSYTDDNWGGAEANAAAELLIERDPGHVPVKMELSFTRSLRNTIIIYGEGGWVEANTNTGYEVMFYQNAQNKDPLILRSHNSRPLKPFEQFAPQLSNFSGSIKNGSKDYVSADEVIPTMAIIKKCYDSRENMAKPWQTKHLESFFKTVQNEK